MAAPVYVDQGGAVAVTTAGAPAYPATVLAGDLLVLFVSTNGTALSNAPAGWTEAGASVTAGGLTVRTWWRVAAGGETGTVTINATGGTKGVGWIGRWRATAGGTLSVDATNTGLDTDTSSTAYNATGASWTLPVDTRLAAAWVALAPTGTFTTTPGATLTQAGATLTGAASKFAGRTASNTAAYGLLDGTVTTAGTGAPAVTATAAGANAGGVARFLRITETSAANQSPTVTVAASTSSPAPGETVTLAATGSDTDGTIASYQWTQTAGPTVTLTGTGATRSFVAPYRRPTDGPTTLTFSVTATDNAGATSAAASASLTVPVHPEWWFAPGWATYGPRVRSAL